MIQLVVNGVQETWPVSTLGELIARKGLPSGSLVIEHNRVIVRQQQWPTLVLKEGDELELLTFVGGG